MSKSEQNQLRTNIELIESMLRNIILTVMEPEFGQDWLRSCLKQEDYDQVQKRFQKNSVKHKNHRVIDELVFDHYKQIMGSSKRRDLFKKYLDATYETMVSLLDPLREIRNNIAHNNWHLIDIEEALVQSEFLKKELVVIVKRKKILHPSIPEPPRELMNAIYLYKLAEGKYPKKITQEERPIPDFNYLKMLSIS